MAGRRPFGFAGVSGQDGFLGCVGCLPARSRATGCAVIGRCVVAGRRLNGDLSAGAVCWRGPASPGSAPSAFSCSTGPGPASGVRGLRAHDVRRATGPASGRADPCNPRQLVVPGPRGNECGRRPVDESNPWGARTTVLTAASAVGFVWAGFRTATPALGEGSPDGEGSPLLCWFSCARWT